MKNNRKYLCLVFLLLCLSSWRYAVAQTLQAVVIANGYVESSGSHSIRGTIGQSIIGSSGNEIEAGFWNCSNQAEVNFVNAKTDNEFMLYQNYPNPFDTETTIRYQLSRSCQVSISVFNALGGKVATLVNNKQQLGNYQIAWDRTNAKGHVFSSGIYFYSMQVVSGSNNVVFQSVKKMLLK